MGAAVLLTLAFVTCETIAGHSFYPLARGAAWGGVISLIRIVVAIRLHFHTKSNLDIGHAKKAQIFRETTALALRQRFEPIQQILFARHSGHLIA
jgi:hypothetical protein